jgi:hypothetical protein
VEQVLLVTIVAVATLTAVVGFMIGDRRRRAQSGHAGPRACRSIGEALEKAESRHGRVLVLFLGNDDSSMEAGCALAEDPEIVKLLGRADLFHVVIRDAQVSRTLFEKYAKTSLPNGAVVLLLDKDGRPIQHELASKAGPLGTWLPDWIASRPLKGSADVS